MSARPLVSCLCVTENRPEFIPWLAWNFAKQDYPVRELVIVDSSPEPTCADGDFVTNYDRRFGALGARVIHVAPGTSVAEKRNIAMREAAGSIFTWWDDDDWQHPLRLSLTADAVTTARPLCGNAKSYFMNLRTGLVRSYTTHGLIFNSLGVVSWIARAVPFRDTPHEDTPHLRMLLKHHQATATVFERPLFFWLCHDRNLENTEDRGKFVTSRSVLRDAVGRWWEDTDDALDALVAALAKRQRS